MAEDDHELIVLSSSDDESKPKVLMKSPKKQTMSITAFKKFKEQCKNLSVNLQPRNISQITKNVSVQRQPVTKQKQRITPQRVPITPKSRTNLPVNKHQTAIQKSNNLQSSVKCTRSTSQQPSNAVKFQSRKSISHIQSTNKNNNVVISNNTLLPSKPNTPKVMHPPILSNARMRSSLVSPEGQNQISQNKVNLPLSVLNSLQQNGISVSSLHKNGISVTNVEEDSKDNSSSPAQSVEAQRYLNSVKHSLLKNNTNIELISESQSEPFIRKDFVKSNSLCQASIKASKRKATDSDTLHPNKLVCIRSISSKNAINSKSDLPLKQVPVTKIIEKAKNITNFSNKSVKPVHVNFNSQNSYNVNKTQTVAPNYVLPVSLQSKFASSTKKYVSPVTLQSKTVSSAPNYILPVTLQPKTVPTVTNVPMISNKALTITPLISTQNKSHKENVSKNVSKSSTQQKSYTSSQIPINNYTRQNRLTNSKNDSSRSSDIAPFVSSSISVTVVKKPELNKNLNQLTFSTAFVEKKSSQFKVSQSLKTTTIPTLTTTIVPTLKTTVPRLKTAAVSSLKTTVPTLKSTVPSLKSSAVRSSKIKCKSIDVARDREALLSALALCDDEFNILNTNESKLNSKIEPLVISIDCENKPFVPALPTASLNDKSNNFVKETIKLKDVPRKILNWPKPVVLLQRIDAFEKYAKENNILHKVVTEMSELSKSKTLVAEVKPTRKTKKVFKDLIHVDSISMDSNKHTQNTHEKKVNNHSIVPKRISSSSDHSTTSISIEANQASKKESKGKVKSQEEVSVEPRESVNIKTDIKEVSNHSAILKNTGNMNVSSIKMGPENISIIESINSNDNQKVLKNSLKEMDTVFISSSDIYNDSSVSSKEDSNKSLNIDLASENSSNLNVSQNCRILNVWSLAQDSDKILEENAVDLENKDNDNNLVDEKIGNVSLDPTENHLLLINDAFNAINSSKVITESNCNSPSYFTDTKNHTLPEKITENISRNNCISNSSVNKKSAFCPLNSLNDSELAEVVKNVLNDIILVVESSSKDICQETCKVENDVNNKNTFAENCIKVCGLKAYQILVKPQNAESSDISSCRNVFKGKIEQALCLHGNHNHTSGNKCCAEMSKNNDAFNLQNINSLVNTVDKEFNSPSFSGTVCQNIKESNTNLISVDTSMLSFDLAKVDDDNGTNLSVDQSVIADCMCDILSQVETLFAKSDMESQYISLGQTDRSTELIPLLNDKVEFELPMESEMFTGNDKTINSSNSDYHNIMPEAHSYSNLLSGSLTDISEGLTKQDACAESKLCSENLKNSVKVCKNDLEKPNLLDKKEISLDYGQSLIDDSSVADRKSPYLGDESDVNMIYKDGFVLEEDEQKKSQVSKTHYDQIITSPKLSLKRNRTDLTPERKDDEISIEHYTENTFKKVKFDQDVSVLKPIFSLEEQQNLCSSASVSFDQLIPEPKTTICLEEQHSSTSLSFNEICETKSMKKFMELVNYSKTQMEETSEKEKQKIIDKMIQQLNSTELWYRNSQEFYNLLETSYEKISNDRSSTFIVLYKIKKELKKHKLKSKGIVKEFKDDSSMACSSPFGNSSTVDNEHNSLSDASNEFHQSGNPPLTFEKINNSISNGSLVVKKISDPEPIDPLLSLQPVVPNVTSQPGKSSLLYSQADNNKKLSKSSTSGSAAIPDINSACNKNVEISEDLKLDSLLSKFSTLSKNASENKFCSSPLASALGLCPVSSKPSTSKKNNTENMCNFPSASESCLSLTKYPQNDAIKNETKGKKSAPASLRSHSVSSDEKNSNPMQDDRNARRIKKLEKTLAQLDKAIKKCQQKELSLDELDNEDSAYVKENLYKKRFITIYRKLCELRKTSTRTGRIIEKRFNYEGSRYRAINEAIQKLINKKKAHEKFPDYSEVLNVVRKVNEEHEMGLTERDISIESERVFKDVGIELQVRRCRDDEELFGCYLTDNYKPEDDPATHDDNLKKVLEENNKKFENSINELIDKYAERQKNQAVDVSEGENEERDSEDNNEEEEEDEEDAAKVDDLNNMDDLPPTNPNSPASDGIPAAHRGASDDDDIIEVGTDSDKSTDSNDGIKREVTVKKEDSAKQSEPSSIVVLEDSDSSNDLPSIQELMGR